MKRLLTISLLLILMGCSTTRRAERRIQRIAKHHPELVTLEAHPIDTLLAMPSIADSVSVPLVPLLSGNTIAIAITTRRGTFTANIIRAKADSLNITYQADIEPIHYTDTFQYAQIVVSEPKKDDAGWACHSHEGRHSRVGGNLLAIAVIILIASFLVLIFRICNRNR